jgi:hypothetical protein
MHGRKEVTLAELHAAIIGDDELSKLVPELLLSSVFSFNSGKRSLSLSSIDNVRKLPSKDEKERAKLSGRVASMTAVYESFISLHHQQPPSEPLSLSSSTVSIVQSTTTSPISTTTTTTKSALPSIGPYDVILLRTSWCHSLVPSASSKWRSWHKPAPSAAAELKLPYDRSLLRLSLQENHLMDDILIRQLHFIMPHILRYARYMFVKHEDNRSSNSSNETAVRIPIDGSSVSLGSSMVPIMGRYRYLISGYDASCAQLNGKVGKSTAFPGSNQLSAYSSGRTLVGDMNNKQKIFASSSSSSSSVPLSTTPSSLYNIDDMDIPSSHAISLIGRYVNV